MRPCPIPARSTPYTCCGVCSVIGRALMAATAGDLLAQGHVSAMLWVLEANTPARRFYGALGGWEVAKREQQRDGFRAIGIAYAWDDLRRLT
jgi:hypothetical protein